MSTVASFPVKTRDMHNHHMDSTMWDEFKFRDDDVIVGSYGKSGSTWLQQIVSQLVFQGKSDINVHEVSPWVELRFPPKEVKIPEIEAQTHRRFLKTHLPVDALNFSPKAKYVFVARDGRDVAWSWYNHWSNGNEDWLNALNGPGLIGDPISKCPDNVKEMYDIWMEEDGKPLWSFWETIGSWWEIQNLPNVMLIHYSDLKKDMEGEIKKIANFLDIDIADDLWPTILEHCSFDFMKKNGAAFAPAGGIFWEGGASTFIHKGTNGRWTDILSTEEKEAYEKIAEEKLGKECADWLKNGSL